METLTLAPAPSISDLATSLKSAFQDSDPRGAERILFSWAESLRAELSRAWSDELLVLRVDKAELEFQVSRLEKELDLLKKENGSLQEKVTALSETVQGFKKREKVSQVSKIGEGFENRTPVKRAFRAACSDSESGSDDNLPIGDVLNIKRGKGENKVAEKNAGGRKRRLVRAGDGPGPESEAGGSGFANLNENCLMDDSGLKDCEVCEVNESDSGGSPVARKASTRKRTRRLNCSDSEEEKDEIEEAEGGGDRVNGSKHARRRRNVKVVPEKKYINLDNSGSEEEEETDTDTESDTLGGFIVNGSEPECESRSEPECDDDSKPPLSEEESDSEDGATLGELFKKIKREKKRSGKKWEFEGEMLADFGKSPELCLNAVCALNRQQTEGEQEIKSTVELNGRGFSQADAPRGSEIAQFLTDNEPWGPVKKTVSELQEHDPSAVEICEKLAKRYSKQLFEIYRNGEDPFFNPSTLICLNFS